MEKSDEKLLAEYAQWRSDEAFRTLAKRHGPLVYGACLRYLRNPDLAEDAAQAVFLVLADKASQIRVHTTLIPWCLTTAKNVCRRVARSEIRRRRHEHALSADIEAADTMSDAALFTALDRLRSDEREAIVLRFVQGLSLAEVGQALGVSEDAARMRVNRGLDRLRRKVVIPVAVPLSLLDRLCRHGSAPPNIRALAFQRPMAAVIAPAGLATVGIIAVLRVGAAVLPGHAKPVASYTSPAAALGSTVHEEETQAAIGVLDKPFTLEYRFAINNLTPQKALDANVATEKKQIDADLDADRISVQEHDRCIAWAIQQSKIRRREGRLTLSYDGDALLVEQIMTNPDPNRQDTLFRKDQSLELFSGNTCCYVWLGVFMSVPPNIPLIGPSLPYLPTLRGRDLLDFDSGLTYRPGKVVLNKNGSVAEFDLGADSKGRYWNRYVLSDDVSIKGRWVARKITHTEDNSNRTDYVLTSGSSQALPHDRFLPDAYLAEDQPIQLNLSGNKYKSLHFSRSKGSADEQIEARRSQP